MNGRRVLVVMPARDEEATIGDVLGRITSEYPSLDVLVVDDGSEDSTAAIATAKGALVVSHGENQGVAAAIQTGRIYALNHGYDPRTTSAGCSGHHPLRAPTPLHFRLKP